MEMTKLLVSGYFKTKPGTDEDSVVFNDFEITIPHRNEEYFQRDAMRLFPVFKDKNKKYKEYRFEGLIRLDIDDMEDIEGKASFLGKDIKEMTMEDLQFLSSYLNIREIPLYKKAALRSMREKAYMYYQEKILNKRVFKQAIEVERMKDEEHQRGMRLGLTTFEIEERIEDILSKSFMMIVNQDDLKNSYNFAKLPPLVIENPDSTKNTVSSKDLQK